MAVRFFEGDGEEPAGNAFPDIRKHWANAEINLAYAKGIIEGYPDGTFRPDAELRQIYDDLIEDPVRRVVAYCRIGERSSHTWFVLHELLGQKNVVNYDGSWVEYGSLIGVPVER